MEYLVSIAGQIAESGEEIIKSCWQKMRQAQKIIRISRGGEALSINYIISLDKNLFKSPFGITVCDIIE